MMFTSGDSLFGWISRYISIFEAEQTDWMSIFTDFLDYLKEEENKEDQI